MVDPMGVDNDPALGGLAEDLGQADDRHPPRVNNIRQHLAGTDRGQLVDVADEQQCGLVRQGPQQSPHQRHVHHRGFVHDQQIAVEWLLLVALEAAGPRVGFEQAMDRLGLEPVLSDRRLAARPVGAQSATLTSSPAGSSGSS